MGLPPLTHHEIIGLVAPFSKCGRRVDLAATDRPARRIVFKPVEPAASEPAIGPLHEVLMLECNENGMFRLVRQVSGGDVEVSLSVRGSDPGRLLREIDAVALSAHFMVGEGFVIARSFNIEATAGEPADRLRFTHGEVRVGGLVLRLRVAQGRGAPAEIDLVDAEVDPLRLPEDLLAVQGLAWTRLRRTRGGWRGNLRLRGGGIERSRDAQGRLEQVAAHLVHTLSEPPARFHERWLVRRWALYLYQLIPILASIGVVSGLMVLQAISWLGNAYVMALVLAVPVLALLAVFFIREIPGVDKPPLPRRSQDPGWRAV